MGKVKHDLDFELRSFYETRSRERWLSPEARRAARALFSSQAERSRSLPAEAGIFLDLFCLGLDEMVVPPKAERKVT